MWSPGGTVGTFSVSLGAVPFSAGQPASYTDASGDLVVVSLKGPGTGTVRFTGTRPADASAIELHGTTALSTLVIKTGPAGTSTGAVAVDGALKALSGKYADLTGDLTATGPLGKLLLRSAGGGTISAPSVRGITTRGDFAAGVSADSIGAMKVAGALAGADVRASSSIGKVVAGSIRDSRIFAGVGGAVTSLPASLSDFANAAATILGVTVKARVAPVGFSNSLIAAPAIGKLSLGAVQTANGGAPLGVAADRVASVSAVLVGGTGLLKRSRLDDPSGSFNDGDFLLRLL